VGEVVVEVGVQPARDALVVDDERVLLVQRVGPDVEVRVPTIDTRLSTVRTFAWVYVGWYCQISTPPSSRSA
jgi:hypothetical protein